MKTYRGTVTYEERDPWAIAVHHAEGASSFVRWQDGVVPEVGRNGFQPEELLELVADRLRVLNVRFPSRYNSLAITKIEEAILWLEERTRDRRARNVEGTHQP